MFENILEISFSVSIIILLLLVLSKFFDKNYTAKWRYFVWLVLVVRLIIPFNVTIEEAPFKMSLPESFTENIPLEKNEVQTSIDKDLTQISSDEIIINDTNNVLTPNNSNNGYKTESNVFSKLKGYDLFTYIYIVCLVLFAIYQIIAYLIFKNKILSSNIEITQEEILTIFYRVKKQNNISKQLSLKLNSKIESPMIVGLINPTLLLNSLKYDRKDLEMILSHEMVHIKRRDIWYKTLLLVARAVHWFNPLVHLMARTVCKDIELSCDAEVVKPYDDEYKRQYSEAILLAVHNGKRFNPAFSTNFNGGKKMLKKRFENIFNTNKKRKGIITILTIVITLLALGLCISCTQNIPTDQNVGEDNQDITYRNSDLGFKLVLPKEWENRYTIEELDNSIEVYSKKIKNNTEWPGLLFSIVRIKGELITENDIAQSPVPEKIVQKGNGYTYLLREPSDVSYPPDNEEMVEEYQSMIEDVKEIRGDISLISNNGPKANNDGFKVVGSYFFTVEIPDTWQIEPTETSMSWVIKENNNYVGRVSFIPYFTNTNESESETEGRTYIQDEEFLRKVEIVLFDEYLEKTILEKIAESFEIIGGPATSIDMQTAAQQYISAGGRSVFGMIESVSLENGSPVNIAIKEMEFLEDDEAPNGFKINIISEVPVEYPIGYVTVLPLAPPNYNNYETYYMLPIKDFLEDYNYEAYYYNFVVASDGEVKMILGRYIP